MIQISPRLALIWLALVNEWKCFRLVVFCLLCIYTCFSIVNAYIEKTRRKHKIKKCELTPGSSGLDGNGARERGIAIVIAITNIITIIIIIITTTMYNCVIIIIIIIRKPFHPAAIRSRRIRISTFHGKGLESQSRGLSQPKHAPSKCWVPVTSRCSTYVTV